MISIWEMADATTYTTWDVIAQPNAIILSLQIATSRCQCVSITGCLHFASYSYMQDVLKLRLPNS